LCRKSITTTGTDRITGSREESEEEIVAFVQRGRRRKKLRGFRLFGEEYFDGFGDPTIIVGEVENLMREGFGEWT